jgi:hypothetical protein
MNKAPFRHSSQILDYHKNLPGTNTLTYLAHLSVTDKQYSLFSFAKSNNCRSLPELCSTLTLLANFRLP